MLELCGIVEGRIIDLGGVYNPRRLNVLRDNPEDFVFPEAMPGKPLSDMAFAMVLRRMAQAELTVHGFRSRFRDWADEVTAHPREVAVMALAHTVKDKTEAATGVQIGMPKPLGVA